MKNEKGSILLQVITTATISLVLVGSITLMLRSQAKKIKINDFIKKRDIVGRRISTYVTIPDILLASASSLPDEASSPGNDLYGNYMLSQCLGLAYEDETNNPSYKMDSGDYYKGTQNPTLSTKNCALKQAPGNNSDDSWYPLLLIPTEDFKESTSSQCHYDESSSKWNNHISCFLAGQTSGPNPKKQVVFSFLGKRSSLDKGHTLSSFIYFRPICDENNTESTCYSAHKLELKYELTHTRNIDNLDDCKEDRCEKNSPLQLGAWPKYEDNFVEISPSNILGNKCNTHARIQNLENGGIECQCMSPFRQTVVERGGELFYKTNHKGPICELVDPICNQEERLVGQTVEGVPICERVNEDLITSSGAVTTDYTFQKTFYSYDSPLYTGASGARYASNICDDQDEEGVCSFYSCRYFDHNPQDGAIQANERVDGWVNDLQVTCESYLKFSKTNTHPMYPNGSYYEELIWSITEKTAAVFLALSENALWIPKLLKSSNSPEEDISMLGRRDLLFPNVGEKLMADNQPIEITGKEMQIPYCNTRRVLADNAPSDAIIYQPPRCPLVVCKYTMTCEYAAASRLMPTR